MHISDLTAWLKSTVPGIILLGAAGSILALLLSNLAGRLLLPPLKGLLRGVLKLVVGHFVRPAVKHLVRLHLLTGEKKFQLFYTLQLMKLVFALALAGCSFALFAVEISQPAQSLSRTVTIAPLIVFFLGLWYGFRCVVIVLVPLHFDVESDIQDKIREARAHLDSEMRKTKAGSEAEQDAPRS